MSNMIDPINFTYEDTDSLQNEISELYSYSEESDFFANRNAFEESMEDCGLPLTWKHMVPEQQSLAINHLMTTLEVSCRTTRIKSCRALAYLIQGNFGECLTLEEQANNSRDNVFLLYKHGIFHSFVQQLMIEANVETKENKSSLLSASSSVVLFNESSELRLILSVLYTITETMYHAKNSTDEKILELRHQFVRELQNPINDELLSVSLFQMLNSFCGGQAPHYPVRKITLLLWKIILITLGGTQELKNLKEKNRKMCNLDPAPEDTMDVVKNMTPCLPMVMVDGMSRPRPTLAGMIANRRRVLKQPAFDDAVYAYAKECLQNSLAELNHCLDELNDGPENLRNDESDPELRNPEVESKPDYENFNILEQFEDEERHKSIAQAENSSDGSSSSDSGIVDSDKESPTNELKEKFKEDIGRLSKNDWPDMGLLEDYIPLSENTVDASPIDESEKQLILTYSSNLKPKTDNQLDSSRSDVSSSYRGLPWTPKVRKADLSVHMQNLRMKFLGYYLPNEVYSTFGLPEPIVEGINVMRRHLYVSLAEVQLEREEAIQKYPLTHSELNPNYREENAEKLYSALLPRLPQHMIALLKILLAASTINSKNKSDRIESINIMAEINPDVSSQSVIQTLKMDVDAIRHKEVIIKAISAILLLLLKHFKVNHIYQFEYVSQQLMFANCIPLILKFLSQDMYAYIVAPRSTISAIDFPACVIGEQPELTSDAIELCSFQPYCWRNMFSCINLVRVLNKLTKWKHSRIMMLVVFKSSQTLLKALSVRQPMFQLYVLKLLKVQLKFLGRQWKKNNMKLISPIYQKVRHRLTDDWAYSNDNEARPWDFQAEEFTLQANINRFHQRRYHDLLISNVGGAKNRNSTIVFDQLDKFGTYEDRTDEDYEFEISRISSHFERNYESWLDSEVFQREINWDKLLD
jgi:hypothetical protein